MQPHTEEQLASLRGYIETRVGEASETFELDGIEVSFSVIHIPDEQRPFQYAVAAAVVPNAEGDLDYTIGVSDDVPEELRGLWAWHEYHDFAVLGAEAEERCLDSEMRVVEELKIDPVLLEEYIEYRTEFYAQLAEYMARIHESDGEFSVYDESDIEGAILAGAFLDSLLDDADEDDFE